MKVKLNFLINLILFSLFAATTKAQTSDLSIEGPHQSIWSEAELLESLPYDGEPLVLMDTDGRCHYFSFHQETDLWEHDFGIFDLDSPDNNCEPSLLTANQFIDTLESQQELLIEMSSYDLNLQYGIIPFGRGNTAFSGKNINQSLQNSKAAIKKSVGRLITVPMAFLTAAQKLHIQNTQARLEATKLLSQVQASHAKLILEFNKLGQNAGENSRNFQAAAIRLERNILRASKANLSNSSHLTESQKAFIRALSEKKDRSALFSEVSLSTWNRDPLLYLENIARTAYPILSKNSSTNSIALEYLKFFGNIENQAGSWKNFVF